MKKNFTKVFADKFALMWLKNKHNGRNKQSKNKNKLVSVTINEPEILNISPTVLPYSGGKLTVRYGIETITKYQNTNEIRVRNEYYIDTEITEVNDSENKVTKKGTVLIDGKLYSFNYILLGKPKNIIDILYSVDNISSPSVEWNITQAKIEFDGHIITCYDNDTSSETISKKSQEVSFEQNLEGSAVTRSGSFDWNTATVEWTVKQGFNPSTIVEKIYNIDKIIPSSSADTIVEWDATSYTVTYSCSTINVYASGEKSNPKIDILKDEVNFDKNETNTIIERTNSVTWNEQTAIWSLGQHGGMEEKEITHTITNISSPSVECDDTSAVITFVDNTIITYRNNTSAITSSTDHSHEVTFSPNELAQDVTKNGSFEYDGITIEWSIKQKGNPHGITNIEYSVDNISSPLVEWDATSSTINFDGIITYIYADSTTSAVTTSQTHDVFFEQNLEGSAVTRSGSFDWNTATVEWTVKQGFNPHAIVETAYSITSITPNSSADTIVEWNVTSYTVYFDGVTTYKFANGEYSTKVETIKENVTFDENITDKIVEQTSNVVWNKQTAKWELGQHGGMEVKNIIYNFISASTPVVEWYETSGTVLIQGEEISIYRNGTSAVTKSINDEQSFTCETNDTKTEIQTKGKVIWHEIPIEFNIIHKAHTIEEACYQVLIEQPIYDSDFIDSGELDKAITTAITANSYTKITTLNERLTYTYPSNGYVMYLIENTSDYNVVYQQLNVATNLFEDATFKSVFGPRMVTYDGDKNIIIGEKEYKVYGFYLTKTETVINIIIK